MDFRDLSMPEAPLIKTHPPGPKSKEYLDYQSLHEGSAVSYPKGNAYGTAPCKRS
ncbi:MAG: hypothetical protein ISS41_12175, partial [Candidatus Aminicenantes bacterium]|nr:hypothetical protein [Candidatus Aminicenantes bacterium]